MRSFPQALLHAPSKMAGLNVPNLYVEQGVAHILKLIQYSKSKRHATGILLRQTCEAMKLELGTNGYLLSNPWALAPLATEGWIKSTWKFAVEYGVTIKDDLPEFCPIRLFDRLLIPLFHNLGFHGQSLRCINQCRIFLRVTWLSEITTADGRKLKRAAIEEPLGLSIREEFLYPTQARPAESSWKIWRKALSQLCIDQFTLKHALGPFLRPEATSWWFDHISNRLYQAAESGTYNVFRKSTGKSTRAGSAKYTFCHTTTIRPSTANPATARRMHDTAYLAGIGMLQVNDLANYDPFRWILESVQWPRHLSNALHHSSGFLQALSDGSFKAGHGTAAWMVAINPECIIRGTAVVPGVSSDQSAYRSELLGIYGLAMTVRYLESNCDFHGEITIGCNGLSALNKSSYDCDFCNPNEPQFDLISAIRQIRQASTVRWHWRHIKGHQDTIRPLQELDHWSLWNIEMDNAAKAHWERTKGCLKSEPVFGKPWPTLVYGKKVVTNMRQVLRETCTTPAALDYWGEKNQFGSLDPTIIDWDCFGAALSAVPMPRQHWICKTISGFAPRAG
jgi:hypothetical protein